MTEGRRGALRGGEEGGGEEGGGARAVACPAAVVLREGGREAGRELAATAAAAAGPGVAAFTWPLSSLCSKAGAGMVTTVGGRASTPPSTPSKMSGRRSFGSMRASLLLSSRSRAPGPRRLALLAGAGAVAAGGAAGEGARVPGSTSCLLGWQPPLLGAWLPCPGTFTFSVT